MHNHNADPSCPQRTTSVSTESRSSTVRGDSLAKPALVQILKLMIIVLLIRC